MSTLIENVLVRLGCEPDIAKAVSDHLIEASLMGVESHGVMRLIQYVDQFESGYMSPRGRSAAHGVSIPLATWEQIEALAARYDVAVPVHSGEQ